MMRSLGKLALTFGVLALLTAPAHAQGGRGFGPGGGPFMLMAPNVQKELKLSDDQIGKVQETVRGIMEKHQDDMEALRDASNEERPAKARVLRKTLNDEVKKELALSTEQSKRFDQISLQSMGLQAFFEPTVLEKLDLTADQKSKVREIGEAAREANRGAFNKDASEEERTEARKKMVASQRENMSKVHALLTDDQKKAWKDLIGDRVEINVPARRPNNGPARNSWRTCHEMR